MVVLLLMEQHAFFVMLAEVQAMMLLQSAARVLLRPAWRLFALQKVSERRSEFGPTGYPMTQRQQFTVRSNSGEFVQ